MKYNYDKKKPTFVNTKHLYSAEEINRIWHENDNNPVIKHPEKGWISPSQLRKMYEGKPCPICGKIMVYGEKYRTKCKRDAWLSFPKYNNDIPVVGDYYYHPQYATIDHIVNKARCPERMFEYRNLRVTCMTCNQEKGDSNIEDLERNLEETLGEAETVLKKWQPL